MCYDLRSPLTHLMALPLSSMVSGGPGQEHSASAALQQGAAQLSSGCNVPQTSAETFCCPALHGLLLSTLLCASGTVFCSPQPYNDQGLCFSERNLCQSRRQPWSVGDEESDSCPYLFCQSSVERLWAMASALIPSLRQSLSLPSSVVILTVKVKTKGFKKVTFASLSSWRHAYVHS